MSSRLIRIALVMSVFALATPASLAQPATEAGVPIQGAPLVPSNSALDVPIEEIAANLAGAAILDRNFPGLRAHTMYRFFKTMSLRQIAAMSHGEITAAMMAQTQIDLSVLPVAVTARGVGQMDAVDLDFDSPGSQDVRHVSTLK